uniref:hypothetical protein n=1 Tax=Veillonella sp. TaxID=1926307 RepID=UPI0025EBC836
MAQFPGLTFTKTGYEMITRSASGLTNDQLIVTKAKLGSGMFNGDIRSLTDVVKKDLEVTLSAYKALGNGQVEYSFVYDNQSVFSGFQHREVGIFAKNGVGGIEKLIAYSNAGDNYSYISDASKAIPLQTMKVVLSIGDTQNISAVVNVANAVTEERLAFVMNQHNTALDAHQNMMQEHNASTNVHDALQALFLKLTGGTVTGTTNFNSTVNLKGTSTGVTQSYSDNSTKIATTAYVYSLINNFLTSGQPNNEKIRKAVEAANRAGYSGSEGDFRDPNKWWGKVPINQVTGDPLYLIIQGG